MGEPKVIDRAYIRGLGRDIDRTAGDAVPSAKRLAGEAQDLMMGAGQGGGLLVVLAFFFASEYAEQAWDTKLTDAGKLDQAAQKIAEHWHTTEERNTIR
ncbi:hypothetical protein ABZV93_20590 [Actinopolymorpha sp. NPDC004070]|uniref:hypothetical protein n=1 Tax=Actinopolymorpha sp. NPDC004070 TaxID=3154548 RepID=UPI0033AE6D27